MSSSGALETLQLNQIIQYYYGVPNFYQVQTDTAQATSTTSSVSAGPAAPPHLQFSNSTIGTTIFLAYGRCKLPGQIIWAPGIDATNNTLDTSLLTFAAAYCEPIDPSESIQIQTMAANGTLFYDRDQGGVISVANVSSDAQAQIATCVANMKVYSGAENQLPDPTMEDYLGVGNVPAYRGLRYIVFTDFPLEISNNAVPNIVVEWRRIDGALIDVSTVMVKLIEHVDFRTQYMQALADAVFGTPTVSGIPDLCLGITVTSQSSLIDHFMAHKVIYNYQIEEGDPIRIVRRQVDSDLVIDMSVNEDELITANGAPALTTIRANPADFPVGMNLTYIDPNHGYDNKVAPAIFDGSAPGRSTATSSAILSAQTDYIVDATTARSLAYAAVFNMRSYAGRATLEMDGVEAEVGDTIEVTTADGDNYVLLVDVQTITKNRSNSIAALQLLTQGGADVNGDGGNNGGSASRKYWPEDVLDFDFVVDTAADKVWSGRDTGGYTFGFNVLSSPLRRISGSKWRDMIAKDPIGANWGADTFFGGDGGLACMFDDAFYVYWLHKTTLTISRLLKSATSMAGIQHLVIPDGFYVDGTTNDNLNFNGNQISCFRDGKLYVAWNGKFAGSGSFSTNFKLIVVDIEAWSVTAFTVNDYAITGAPHAVGIAVTDNGTVVIATNSGSGTFTGDYYHANISSLSSWSHTSGTFPMVYGYFAAAGNKAYFAEIEQHQNHGYANRKSRVAVVDVSSGLSETVIDLNVKDSNYISHAQFGHNVMWTSGSHLFVAGNHTNGRDGFERRYLGRFDLGTLTAAGGKFLSAVVYNETDLYVRIGHVFDGNVYVAMSAFDQDRDSFLALGEDLSAPHLYWTTDVTSPVNDLFAGAVLIFVDQPQTNDLSYASTEIGEPVPAFFTTGADPFFFNNGHSVWYRFTAPATDTYTIVARNVGTSAGSDIYGIVVYTGTDVAALTYVDGVGQAFASHDSTLSFAATASTVYMISIRRDNLGGQDVFGGALDIRGAHEGRFTIDITGTPIGSGGSGGSGSLDPPAGYYAHALLFEDLFTGGSLDSTKWIPQIADQFGVWQANVPSGTRYSGVNAGNFDAEYFDANQLATGVGGLKITATRDTSFAGYTWKSGAISTHGKFSFTGGYVQIRMKQPDTTTGGWPCLWCLEGGGEIDLQEGGYVNGAVDPNKTLALNLHVTGVGQTFNTVADLSTDFHVYGMEYIPGTSVKFYLDGVLIRTITTNVPSGAMTVVVTLQIAQGTSPWHTVNSGATPSSLEMDVSCVQVWHL